MFRVLPIFENENIIGLDWETNLQPYSRPESLKVALDYLTVMNPASDFASKYKNNWFEKNNYTLREIELWAEIANILSPLFVQSVAISTTDIDTDAQAAMTPIMLLRNCFMFIYNQRKLIESYYEQYGIAPCDKKK